MPLQCRICSTSNKDGTRFCKQCGNPLLKGERYYIVDLLGQGGMGAVYKAWDTQNLNRYVALKELRLSQGMSSQEVREAERQFQAEAQILAGLYHPHIVDVAGIFQEGANWYIVMSFVLGETLEDLQNRLPAHRLPVSQALDIGKQLADALHYLHTWQNPLGKVQPIIFRDLKPANVMVTSGIHTVLIDFGIARLFKQGQSNDTTAYGSLGYAAPEQFGRSQTTAQSDLYSLGRLLHSILTGDDPADRGIQDSGQSVYDPRHPVSAHLDDLLKRMQDIQVATRPNSAQEVCDVLDYVLSHWNESTVQQKVATRLIPPAAAPSSTIIRGNSASTQAPPAAVRTPTGKSTAAVSTRSSQPPDHSLQSLASPFPTHVTIFSLFASEDIPFVTDIKEGLQGALRSTTSINFRDKSCISAGTDHKEYMVNALTSADIILFFVSASFLASESISIMTNRALLLHNQEHATVVPLVVRPCMYTYSSFSNLPMHPQDHGGNVKPITRWRDRDAATVKVVDALTQVLKDLHIQGRL